MPYEISARVRGVTEVLAPDKVDLNATKEATVEKRIHEHKHEDDVLAR